MVFLTLFIPVLLQSAQKQSALAYLNKIRRHAGLIVLQPNTNLSRAAKAHSRYLLRQQKFGHYEHKGWKGYTGRTPSERVVAAGYPTKAVMENVSVNANGYHRSIDTLLSAIYHRFVFLNFDKNEMGAGSMFGRKNRKIVSAFVYLLGSSKISRLCQTASPLENGIFYIKDLCSDDIHIVPQYRYEQARQAVRRENSPLVLFPYPGEKGVPTVFYTEHPHPLPGSKMSGYPISVQFNPAFYTEVRLKKFRLYDAGGKRVTKVKIITFRNDVNHRFTPLQFALMPLKRLRHAERYQVEFDAVADGKRVVRHWKFSTRKHVGR
jgi:hypothetical protein